MNTFKRKALTAAVLGAMGVAGSAQAIVVNPNNTGEALLYPYYTVNAVGGNSWWTFLSVANTTTNVKVVKVRFREGKNSAEVLDFNLYLSPNDMWTGAVLPASADSASPAHLVTNDVSCTNPPIPATGVDFRNYSYKGDILAHDGLDRTREGYIEIFEMGELDPTAGPGTAAVHGSSGSPSCAGLTGLSVPAVAAAIPPIAGGIFGNGTLINVNSGRDTMYNATAFANWNTGNKDYNEIGTTFPKWADTTPPASVVVTPLNTYFSTFGAGANLLALPGDNAFISTIMHTNVLNEYVLDTASNSNTDWVLTFPDKNTFITPSIVDLPYTNSLTASGACEQISVTYFNREELTQGGPNIDFSPTPPGATPNSMCWESTVLSFRNGTTHAPSTPAVPSLVLGSQNVTAIGLASTFQNGWANLRFVNPGASATGLVPTASASLANTDGGAGTVNAGAATFLGLPTIGFMIRTFDNGNLTCGTATCQGNYGGSASHVYQVNNP